jgi:hypothetical protein
MFVSYIHMMTLSAYGSALRLVPFERAPSSRVSLLGVGWEWFHSVRRPPTDLLYQPRTIDDECRAVDGMRIGRGNQSILSTTNPRWFDLGSNPGHRCGNPAINRLGYGTARVNLERFTVAQFVKTLKKPFYKPWGPLLCCQKSVTGPQTWANWIHSKSSSRIKSNQINIFQIKWHWGRFPPSTSVCHANFHSAITVILSSVLYSLGDDGVGKKQTWNKKLWEELVTYFPMIRHGRHRKRLVQQFF